MEKPKTKCQPRPFLINNSKDLPPIHTKRVKKKKSRELSIDSDELRDLNSPKFNKKLSLGEYNKSTVFS